MDGIGADRGCILHAAWLSMRRTAPSDWVLGALLAAVVIVTWWPALGASFQFDDWNVIVRDPRVQSLSAWLASMPGIRPLLKLSYALNHATGGVAGFRAFNLVVHALNVALVLRLLAVSGRRFGLPSAQAVFAALAGAAVFALHPVQTEAVTYVSGRSSSLSATFALVSLLAWLRGLDTPAETRWRLASFALFVAALGVKEPVVALPAVMAAWLVADGAASTIPRRIAPHALLVAGGALLVLAWGPYRAVLEGSLGARSLGSNLLTQVDGVWWLLGQMLRPDLLNADPALPVATPGLALAARALGLLLAAAAGAALLRSRPAVGFALCWFFLWLLPTNSLVPRLDVANDRQLYLAIVGPGWLLGLLLARTWPRAGAATARGAPAAPHRVAPLAVLALALLCAGLATATRARNLVYADEIAFWRDVATQSPHNARAANNLGFAYALACRDAEALAEFARAMRLGPRDSHAALNHALLSRGELFADNQRPRCAAPPLRDATR